MVHYYSQNNEKRTSKNSKLKKKNDYSTRQGELTN